MGGGPGSPLPYARARAYQSTCGRKTGHRSFTALLDLSSPTPGRFERHCQPTTSIPVSAKKRPMHCRWPHYTAPLATPQRNVVGCKVRLLFRRSARGHTHRNSTLIFGGTGEMLHAVPTSAFFSQTPVRFPLVLSSPKALASHKCHESPPVVVPPKNDAVRGRGRTNWP